MNLDIFSTRYSCRNFKNEKLSDTDLRAILEVARQSPSSLGLEPWKFILFTNEREIKEIAPIANNQAQVANAAALIVIVSRIDFAQTFESKLRARDMSEADINMRLKMYKPFLENMSESQKLSYSREQAHIALASIMYAANALNIASCAIGGFDSAKLDNYLHLDTDKMRSALIVALGKSADAHVPQKSRASFDEVVEIRQ